MSRIYLRCERQPHRCNQHRGADENRARQPGAPEEVHCHDRRSVQSALRQHNQKGQLEELSRKSFDPNQNEFWQGYHFDYDAWGNILSATSSVPALARNRYRFQGREWSAATGFTNFRMRWYDAETGRWLSKDPIGLSGGLNLYVFCNMDSVNHVDVLGCCPTPGEKARDWARKQIGKKKYNPWGLRGFPRWWGRFKCNLFVADAYNTGNGREIVPTGIFGTKPPTASDWYNGKVPSGFTQTNNPQVGDVISDGSHVGIVAEPGETSISASSIDNQVIENDWGFRSGEDVRVWHYNE